MKDSALAGHVEEFEEDFAFLRPNDCRLGNRIVLDLACNWKFDQTLVLLPVNLT